MEQLDEDEDIRGGEGIEDDVKWGEGGKVGGGGGGGGGGEAGGRNKAKVCGGR